MCHCHCHYYILVLPAFFCRLSAAGLTQRRQRASPQCGETSSGLRRPWRCAEAGEAIDAWDSKVAELKMERGEEPTTGPKASLLLEMLLDQVRFDCRAASELQEVGP